MTTETPWMTVTLEGDRQIVVTRRFAAPPERVFAAHTDPALLRRWMLGPEGWSMTRCDSELRAGGGLRFDWADMAGNSFYLTGEYLAVEPPRRILHLERMHLPDPTPDNRVESLFQDDGAGGTRLVMTMTAPDAATRTAMVESGMEQGMAASYARLDPILETMAV